MGNYGFAAVILQKCADLHAPNFLGRQLGRAGIEAVLWHGRGESIRRQSKLSLQGRYLDVGGLRTPFWWCTAYLLMVL